jgi:hypothetical protein
MSVFDKQDTADAYHLGKNDGREEEWRLHKHSRDLWEVLSEWLEGCNHPPEANCVHQRRAQKLVDKIRGVGK